MNGISSFLGQMAKSHLVLYKYVCGCIMIYCNAPWPSSTQSEIHLHLHKLLFSYYLISIQFVTGWKSENKPGFNPINKKHRKFLGNLALFSIFRKFLQIVKFCSYNICNGEVGQLPLARRKIVVPVWVVEFMAIIMPNQCAKHICAEKPIFIS